VVPQPMVADHGSRLTHRTWATPSTMVAGSPAPPLPHPPGPRASGELVPPVERMEPVDARPTPRRSAAPLPPWLGGGPSNAVPEPPDRPGRPHGDARSGREDVGRTLDQPGSAHGPGSSEHGPGTSEQAPGTSDWRTAEAPRSSGRAAAGHVVQPNDTLWDIAAARLAPADRSAANIHRYWQQVYRANRSVVGPDPNLIHPGMRLVVPPYRHDRR
jgi:hypothetical protein